MYLKLAISLLASVIYRKHPVLAKTVIFLNRERSAVT